MMPPPSFLGSIGPQPTSMVFSISPRCPDRSGVTIVPHPARSLLRDGGQGKARLSAGQRMFEAVRMSQTVGFDRSFWDKDEKS